MNKEKIFVNNSKTINNNQKYCNVNEFVEDNKQINNNLSVNEKIEKLFNKIGYVFNTNVKIITDNKVYQTKIAGKVNNHLITLDNDVIDISTIKDIIY